MPITNFRNGGHVTDTPAYITIGGHTTPGNVYSHLFRVVAGTTYAAYQVTSSKTFYATEIRAMTNTTVSSSAAFSLGQSTATGAQNTGTVPTSPTYVFGNATNPFYTWISGNGVDAPIWQGYMALFTQNSFPFMHLLQAQVTVIITGVEV